ncbi:MAG: hypothetical protein FD138_153 [Planctomycetota bacterium]|nr:MAG: hypothetical protein FD138_153 [Planctomycetota bacterium]
MTDPSQQFSYVTNPIATITGPRGFQVDVAIVERAVHRTRSLVKKLAAFEIDVFALLGMRNLSSFVGEVFAAAMILEAPAIFRKNPHQDGYPDLLLMDEAGLNEWTRLQTRTREKMPFSGFATGGFEVKATCGSVPTPVQCQKKGYEKPDIGDQRLGLLSGYDWKAHHRETNSLFGIFWDFIHRCPTIVAIFYSANLTENDWGKIIQPKEGGGRTTSVSIMTRRGVQKMYDGWLLMLNDTSYGAFFDKKNQGNHFASAMPRQ